MLSLDQVKRHIAEFSGIIPMVNDMCFNGCIAFTGPWLQSETCPKCGED
jgi:hypothetical protein